MFLGKSSHYLSVSYKCLGLTFLHNISVKSWEAKLKWTGLALYLLLFFSLIIVWAVLPDMKARRNSGVPCTYFKICQQADGDFECQN